MKFYISYFYQIRFMKPYQIPVSTAAWDPKWFHKGIGNNWTYLDKNGVLNGLRFNKLSPENLHPSEICCPCEMHKVLPEGVQCKFLTAYGKYLKHALDFNSVIEELINNAKSAAKDHKLPDPEDIILIVYETPDNPCSERGPLIEWFKENGVELKEWSKYNKDSN